MPELVTKISLQEKIAELERRIVRLEGKKNAANSEQSIWDFMRDFFSLNRSR